MIQNIHIVFKAEQVEELGAQKQVQFNEKRLAFLRV